jgi:uncharacterized protein (TIGR03083 family)
MTRRDPTVLARRGMTDEGRARVEPMVLAAWDAFLDVAEGTDLAARTRLRGWRAHEVCVHLGAWDDYRALDTIVASARAGCGSVGGTDMDAFAAPDVDAANARVVARHRDAGRDDVLAALRRHRDGVARLFRENGPELDGAPAASPVGRLPLLTVVLGEAYELAVHALDLHDAGGPRPASGLLLSGVAALADVTGALAAAAGIEGGAAFHTPDGGWAFATAADGWTVTPDPNRRPDGTVVSGPADVLLDTSAGRGNPVVQLARRRLVVQDMPGLLRLAPIVETAPNIPGGPLLAVAARTVSRGAGLVRRSRTR